MRAGIFQCAGGGLTPHQRLARLEAHLEQHDLDIVVCPELFMSGYNIGACVTTLAEPDDGEFAVSVSNLAKTNETAIVYGYPELDGDDIFNSALCIGADGKVLANYRKMLPPPGFEARYFSGGDGPSLFEIDGIKCAILICYDAEFPESVRAVAEAGAQIVIVPTALVDNWHAVAFQLMPTRAFENGVWLLYANHAGEEGDAKYLGGSCIIAPDGTDKARAGSGEALIAAKIDVEANARAQARLPYLADVQALRKKLNLI
ncbi:MAG: carbon-nitrogen hydrolase family protein [Rhizobiales bacterium]|nr:carbon-nitrogen hydrolase family protein [Hyphomicrobiales bacterium]